MYSSRRELDEGIENKLEHSQDPLCPLISYSKKQTTAGP